MKPLKHPSKIEAEARKYWEKNKERYTKEFGDPERAWHSTLAGFQAAYLFEAYLQSQTWISMEKTYKELLNKNIYGKDNDN